MAPVPSVEQKLLIVAAVLAVILDVVKDTNGITAMSIQSILLKGNQIIVNQVVPAWKARLGNRRRGW